MQKFLNKKKKTVVELLVENEIFENEDMARRNIMAGNVVLNENLVNKCGLLVDTTKKYDLRLKKSYLKYVSRGALKLEEAIKKFNLDFLDKIVLDVGASTGGFTDCALYYGAKFVYSVDVGTNQLHWKLRKDKRVKSLENTHIKDLKLEEIKEKIDFIVMDVSFISIKSVLPHLLKFINENTKVIFLIKPQFEVADKFLEKGIVKDLEIHKDVIYEIIELAKINNLFCQNLCISPIKGAKGNIEYLSYFSNLKQIEKRRYSLGEIEIIV